jgi:type IV pilus assembly protein PilM
MIDYQILGDDPKEADKVRVLIAATTKKLYDAHVEILKDLELRPGVIDLDQLASINSYIIGRELPDEGVLIFLNIGCRKTNLTVIGRRDPFFTRDINIAGYSFTDELVKKFGLDTNTAEQVKKQQGMNPDMKTLSDSTEVQAFRVAEKSIVDKLTDEINRSLRYYVKETGQSMFTQIILTGGSSALKGLDEILKNKFNVPVMVYDPLLAHDWQDDSIYGPQFSVAVGLALRGD